MQDLVFTPTDFVATLNQTLEFAYPSVIIEGEISNFKVAKNRWVYFDLKDEESSVRFFGTVYSLPGPLEDGMTVRVSGSPRLHQRFGFSINFVAILPVGEGALKKAADLLFKKLSAEGLFSEERKRYLPRIPAKIGLITAADSAAAADFIKILNERWSGTEILMADVYVQGEQAPLQIVEAVEHLNQLKSVPEVIVITRGGGSADDLAAFSDERVVRAVAGSRIPTLVAIGHEVDLSLAELAADQRASTPSNAAQILVPDKNRELEGLNNIKSSMEQNLESVIKSLLNDLHNQQSLLKRNISDVFFKQYEQIKSQRRLVKIFDPTAVLARGYAILTLGDKFVKSTRQVKVNDILRVKLVDGTIGAKVETVKSNEQQ
jgi:exodeoxyribonuclease VII large subunit